jgi:hypothetical protein
MGGRAWAYARPLSKYGAQREGLPDLILRGVLWSIAGTLRSRIIVLSVDKPA